MEALAPTLSAFLALDPRGGFLGQQDMERAVDIMMSDAQARPALAPPEETLV